MFEKIYIFKGVFYAYFFVTSMQIHFYIQLLLLFSFSFHSGTNWRENAVLGTKWEKFEISINIKKNYKMCASLFCIIIPIVLLVDLRMASF